MAKKVSITKTKLDDLANAVAAKSAFPVCMTVQEMTSAVLGLKVKEDLQMQEKTVTPTHEGVTVLPDDGYYGLANVTVEPPQMQEKTVTPTQDGVSVTPDDGYYGLAKVTVEPYPNNTPASNEADVLIERMFTSYENSTVRNIGANAFDSCKPLLSISFPACESIGECAFQNCYSLTNVNFPACTSIGSYAFRYCSSLTSISFPACTSIGNYAFNGCSTFSSVNFPACTGIGSGAFQGCSNLTAASFPKCRSIYTSAFRSCYHLISLYLLGSSVCSLRSAVSYVFKSTPIYEYSASAQQYGSIFVPASLLTSYKTAMYWNTISSRIVAYDG